MVKSVISSSSTIVSAKNVSIIFSCGRPRDSCINLMRLSTKKGKIEAMWSSRNASLLEKLKGSHRTDAEVLQTD